MKKILCFVLICATILSISAFAEDFDVYSYTYDELVTIRELVDDRLKELDKLAEQAAKETECFQVYIDVTSEYYVFSDRYDVELYLDNTLLATIPNGEEFYQLLEVTKGQHTFTFYKKGDHKVHYSKTVIVSMDVMYSGDIVHEDEISLINFQIDFGLSKAFIELTNKSGMLLSSAESALKADGFVNIRYEPYADIWNTDNWLVISQDPQSATSLDKHEKVTLYCTAFEDHLSSEYVGKDAYTTTEYCKSLGISCTYRDSDSNEKLTSSFSKMNKAEMEKWEVRSVSYSSKSATIYVKKVGSSIPTKKPTATPTKKPTATPTKKPTATPTKKPTATPTKKPTATPTKKPTATPTKKPTATPTKKPTATPTKIPQNITIENNADFAYYFKQPSEIYQTCDSFVKSHKGEYVEFDGYVVSLQNHGTYSTRYDVMLCGFTTYSNAFTEMKGFFSFSDVNFNDMHVSGSDTVSRGLAFHIIGKVVGISEDGLSMLLKPVSMQYLDPDVDRRTNVPNTDTPNTSTNTSESLMEECPFEYMYKREFPNDAIYYLFDTDTNVFIDFITHDIGVSVNTFIGTDLNRFSIFIDNEYFATMYPIGTQSLKYAILIDFGGFSTEWVPAEYDEVLAYFNKVGFTYDPNKYMNNTTIRITKGCNARKTPDYSGEIIMWVDVPQEFEYIDETNGWYLIKLADGRQAYVPADRAEKVN